MFAQKATRITEPAVSINPDGRIALNATAAHIFHEHGVESVLLMWDKETRKMALRPTSNKRETRAYRVSYGKRVNAAGISAKSFVDYIGWNYGGKRRTMVAQWNASEGMLEMAVQADYLKSALEPKPLPVQKKRVAKAS